MHTRGSRSNGGTVTCLAWTIGRIVAAAMAGCLWSGPSFALDSGGRLHEVVHASGPAAATAPPVSNEASRTTASTVVQEFRYAMPRAGEVILVWGVNGWQPLPDDIRPPGTVIKKALMHSPMMRHGNTFVVTVRVPRGDRIDYGFLITKLCDGAEARIWDGAERYHHTASEAHIIEVPSTVTLDPFGNPIGRRGIVLFAVLAAGVVGLIVVSIGLIARRLPTETEQAVPVVSSNTSAFSGDVRFAAVVTALFLGLGFVALLSHEMWRDELQAWRIAASSSSLIDLFRTLRYEGHPALWYLALYGLSRFSKDPFAMQIFHLLLASAGVYLLARFAPFTRLQKLCFAFGYFPLYEYGAISRGYVIGVVALMAFCALQEPVRRRSALTALLSALLLAVMANTSLYGAMLALAFGLVVAFDWLPARKGERWSSTRLIGVLGLLVIGVGIVASIAQTIPPADSSPHVAQWNAPLDDNRLEWTVAQIWKSYVPIPMGTVAFWNTNILDGIEPVRVGSWQITSLDVQAMLSIGLFGLAVRMLASTPTIMLVYIIGSVELLVFGQIKYFGGLRHAGHLFLILIACLWLSLSRMPAARPASVGAAAFADGYRATIPMMTLLLIVQATAGLLAVTGDFLFSFSASKEVARFLTEHRLSELPMIGSKHYIASAVALQLDRPMHYAESDHVGTYIVWKAGRRPVGAEELLQKADTLAAQNGQDVVLVLTYDLGAEGGHLRKLGSFTDEIITNERYVVYLKCHAKADRAGSLAASAHSRADEHGYCP